MDQVLGKGATDRMDEFRHHGAMRSDGTLIFRSPVQGVEQPIENCLRLCSFCVLFFLGS
jgi:hypothetical protein